MKNDASMCLKNHKLNYTQRVLINKVSQSNLDRGIDSKIAGIHEGPLNLC